MKPIYRFLLAGIITAAVRLPAQTITSQPTSQVVPPGGSVSFTVAVSGTGPYSYHWQLAGTNLPSLIATVAGGGGYYPNDGSPATNVTLSPQGLALDASGNLFIADSYWNRIFKVRTNGIIVSVAGSGSPGLGSYSGDGRSATNANLNQPSGVTLDTTGNLFIADTSNNRIRKVDTNNIITTVAGNGNDGFSGDGGGILATDTSLWLPYGVAVDSTGNLFIADQQNSRVRKVRFFTDYSG